MIGKINIIGHIGDSFVDGAGIAHVGTNLLSVIDQAASFPEAKEFNVFIDSPGGYVDVGDSIYEYLTTLKKKGIVINTIQTGLVGSIATKIFLVGTKRVVDDRYEFWIHNPYQENVSGDADELQKAADSTAQTETALRAFYSQFTPIGDEALDSLIKLETGLTADQCIKFGFATDKKKTPVFNLIKMKTEKSFMEHVRAFFSEEPKKGVQPVKAAIPVNEAKSLVVNLAEGAGSFWVEAEAVAEGVSAFLLDEAGQPTQEPLADGEYMLEDGSKLSVVGGKVASVSAKVMEDPMKEDPLTADKVKQMIQDALAGASQNSLAEIAKVKEESKNEILALKKTMKLGVQPTKGFMSSEGTKLQYKSIAERMAEKAEERKKQLNTK